MTAKLKQPNLIDRLLNANVVCNECGLRYGKYSVGCSSRWVSECDVCGERKGVTEVRDYGYLAKGIYDEKERLQAEATANDIFNEVITDDVKARIKQQSVKVANYIASQEEHEPASYEQGEIACMFTEEEIGFLNECLDVIQEHHPGLEGDAHPTDVALFESIEQKITTLYEDNCIKYELSPALKAYYEKYGAYGTESEMEMARWEGFRDAYGAVQNLK